VTTKSYEVYGETMGAVDSFNRANTEYARTLDESEVGVVGIDSRTGVAGGSGGGVDDKTSKGSKGRPFPAGGSGRFWREVNLKTEPPIPGTRRVYGPDRPPFDSGAPPADRVRYFQNGAELDRRLAYVYRTAHPLELFQEYFDSDVSTRWTRLG